MKKIYEFFLKGNYAKIPYQIEIMEVSNGYVLFDNYNNGKGIYFVTKKDAISKSHKLLDKYYS